VAAAFEFFITFSTTGRAFDAVLIPEDTEPSEYEVRSTAGGFQRQIFLIKQV